MGLSPAQGPQDTCKTQGTDERFFSGDFERTSGAGATMLWHRVVELPKGREGGRGMHPLASSLSLWLLQPGPQSGSSGLQSLLAVVVKVVHGEGGCVMGTGVLGDSQSLRRKIALGKKGLERSTMTAAKRPVRGRIHRLMTGF